MKFILVDINDDLVIHMDFKGLLIGLLCLYLKHSLATGFTVAFLLSSINNAYITYYVILLSVWVYTIPIPLSVLVIIYFLSIIGVYLTANGSKISILLLFAMGQICLRSALDLIWPDQYALYYMLFGTIVGVVRFNYNS
jgi:hypothetical protein